MAKQQHIIRQFKRWALAIGLIVIIAVAAALFLHHGNPPQTPAPNPSLPASYAQSKPDYEKLIGDWGRTDGDYVIRISSANPDGKIQAAYFNPNPIHVAAANAAFKNNTVTFFLELQDTGYPGSKYNLVYDAGQDSLEGTYFQAQAQQVYDVEFQRITLTPLKKGY